jgi:hypothetical protein
MELDLGMGLGIKKDLVAHFDRAHIGSDCHNPAPGKALTYLSSSRDEDSTHGSTITIGAIYSNK